jgi:hypothetical protein
MVLLYSTVRYYYQGKEPLVQSTGRAGQESSSTYWISAGIFLIFLLPALRSALAKRFYDAIFSSSIFRFICAKEIHNKKISRCAVYSFPWPALGKDKNKLVLWTLIEFFHFAHCHIFNDFALCYFRRIFGLISLGRQLVVFCNYCSPAWWETGF